jgi:hypothetical protein
MTNAQAGLLAAILEAGLASFSSSQDSVMESAKFYKEWLDEFDKEAARSAPPVKPWNEL